MWHILGKTAIIVAIPKIINEVEKFLTGLFEEEPELPKLEHKPKKHQKLRDSTKITQYMYDYIVWEHTQWVEYNKTNPDKRTYIPDLVKTINETTGMDKGDTSLYNIWSGKIKKSSLPKGKAYFQYNVPHNIRGGGNPLG